ncbi:hypothetical protein TNCV_3562661 [Trichonephila clavipes]|nr:hypothetical protein TNCV_3562661 [Trichonephila clavipes]
MVILFIHNKYSAFICLMHDSLSLSKTSNKKKYECQTKRVPDVINEVNITRTHPQGSSRDEIKDFDHSLLNRLNKSLLKSKQKDKK